MVKRVSSILSIIIAIGMLSACSSSLHHVSSYPYVERHNKQEHQFYMYVDELVDRLVYNVHPHQIDNLAISSIVDLGNLNVSSNFGRQLSEAMFAAFSQRHIKTIDPRFTGRFELEPMSGEFALTRNAEKLAQDLAVSYMVVGSFEQVTSGRHLNVRIIELSSKEVLSAAYIYIPNQVFTGERQVEPINGGLERHETVNFY